MLLMLASVSETGDFQILSDPTRGLAAEAERSYRAALELHPNYEQAMNNLANILRENGQLEEAEKWLTLAVQVQASALGSDFSASEAFPGEAQLCSRLDESRHRSERSEVAVGASGAGLQERSRPQKGVPGCPLQPGQSLPGHGQPSS